ncbi:hypothetical protein BT96DRAFT_933336 [Gymnopus androsaceus JB14]|uniref:Uncharacterized protein n=1 Tax=Gymnopus androsaceus JB14 TaxID=1447944 RepID=A0A6A4IAE1_9AGAR|nr:hypothetical protein BT96DRAFT_933336 [Gymnopus androsaceus JB14]
MTVCLSFAEAVESQSSFLASGGILMRLGVGFTRRSIFQKNHGQRERNRVSDVIYTRGGPPLRQLVSRCITFATHVIDLMLTQVFEKYTRRSYYGWSPVSSSVVEAVYYSGSASEWNRGKDASISGRLPHMVNVHQVLDFGGMGTYFLLTNFSGA